MSTYTYSLQIMKELEKTLTGIDDQSCEELIDHIINARRIFVAGMGRSRLMLQAFAMRLMHLGLTVYVVGEIVTPAIGTGDLLMIGSGSGETESLVFAAQKAQPLGASIALVTIFPDSSIGRIADVMLKIKAPTSKLDTEYSSIQPGASCFEQSMLLVLDAFVLKIADRLALNANESLKLRHANLE